jgi:outer membrane lipoprotein-sorting protein
VIVNRFLIAALLLVTPSLAAAPDLATTLKNMDQAAAKFEGMKADIQRVNYTAIVDDKNIESGEIRVRRDKDRAVTLLMEIKEPTPLILAVKGTKAEIYRPRISEVEEYNLSEHKNDLEQAFSLGFGTSGTFLKDNYAIKVLGEENVGSQPAIRLELTPKDADLLRRMPKIEIWVSTQSWSALQQKVYENSGDYSLNTYSNVALNPGLKESDLQLKLPRNVKRVRPQR